MSSRQKPPGQEDAPVPGEGPEQVAEEAQQGKQESTAQPPHEQARIDPLLSWYRLAEKALVRGQRREQRRRVRR